MGAASQGISPLFWAVLISMAQYGDTGDGCEILHQLIDGKHPLIYRVSTIQGGAGFLPSTVWLINHGWLMFRPRWAVPRIGMELPKWQANPEMAIITIMIPVNLGIPSFKP